MDPIMPVWSGIIVHHADIRDNGASREWNGIRKFHMSWRFKGEAISPEEAAKLIADGVDGVIMPWIDIGYHYGVEMVNQRLEVQIGRPTTMFGAHCIGKNRTHLGLCFVGDFDDERPDDAHYYQGGLLIRALMVQYPSITLDRVEPHRKYADKSCPGLLFDMDRLLSFVGKA